MTRMSDILKKLNVNDVRDESSAAKHSAKEVKQHKPKKHKSKHRANNFKEVKQAVETKAVDKIKESNNKQVDNFAELVEVSTNIFTKGKNYIEKLSYKKLSTLVESIYSELKTSEYNLLSNAYKFDSSQDNYLISHSTASCIYATKFAIELNYSKESCIELGVAGLLYDLGMLDYISIVNKADPLSEAEYETQQSHVAATSRFISLIEGIPERITEAAAAHHERIDGSGYPNNLKRAKINEFAQILGIIDVYNALIHNRKHREKFSAIDATELIIDNKDSFSYKLIKFLVASIGLFPVGSMIELNTGEKAEITVLNNLIPLRPTVKIIYDSHGESIVENKVFDLTKHQTLFIARSL